MPRKGMKDLSDRTPGEELWLRRRLLGFSQEEAALVLGVAHSTVASWEARKGLATKAAEALGGLPRPPGGRATPGDLAALARRRQGWGSFGTAERVGVSRMTLFNWERASDERLVAFWEGRGFSFG
jgi:DNA-binding transcriptional regulator YiaG